MLHLDPRSVVIVSVVLWLVCALLLSAMRRELPHVIRGVDSWVQGFSVMFVATAIIGQGEYLPVAVTAVFANALLWAGMSACVTGLRRFAGRSVSVPALVLGGGAYVAAKIWFTMVHPDFSAQLVVNAVFVASIQLALLETAMRIRPYSRPVKLMVGSCAVGIGIAMLRILAVLTGVDTTANLFDPTPFQKAYLMSYGLTWLLTCIAFILMVNERLHTGLRHAAAYDALSGLLNRSAVIAALEREIDRSSRHGGFLSIMMIDIDYFKQINDSYGHAVGDRAIVDFAARANLQLRRSDIFGRYGGEEFLAVLPQTDPTKAVQVAERVRIATAEESGGQPSYTVSIGVAGFSRGMAADDLLRAADDALYRAKEAGRNRVDPEPSFQ